MRLTILGCGASTGVPVIGCQCAVCIGGDRRNIRSRASVLLEDAQTRLLIDMSPDLHQQALRHGIGSIDAVFVTHEHADHTHGVDDIKAFNYQQQGPIPCYSDARTLHVLQERFGYAIAAPETIHYGYRPSISPIAIEAYQSLTIGSLELTTFLQLHGKITSLGVRAGNIAYSTDVNNLPERSLQVLESLDVWVVDCLQYETAPTHAHLAMTLEWIERLKPKLAILTHMNHYFDYRILKQELPPHVVPGYDGLAVRFDPQKPGVFSY